MANPQGGNQKCTGGGGTGQRFTYAQLEGLWIKAGGPRDKAPIMAAIAMAESGGCSAALNSAGACGLWQIHPRQAGCLDPATNARQAVAKYQGQGLTAWTTYTTGAYKGFLSSSTTPDLNVPGKGTDTQTSSSTASASTCLVGLPSVDLGIGHVGGGCAISKTEGRAFLGGGLILGGGAVMALGVLLLAAYGLKSSGAGKAAGTAVEAVGAATALVPGAELAGAGIIAAGSRVKKAGQAGAEQRARNRAARRQTPPAGAAPQQAKTKAPAGP